MSFIFLNKFRFRIDNFNSNSSFSIFFFLVEKHLFPFSSASKWIVMYQIEPNELTETKLNQMDQNGKNWIEVDQSGHKLTDLDQMDRHSNQYLN